MQDETLYVLALRKVPGIGDVLAKQLISYCGSSKAIFAESRGKLQKIPLVGKKSIDAIFSSECLKVAEVELNNCAKNDISIIPYYHTDYPEKLKLVNDAPLVLFYKGEKSYKNRKVVGIVGTRNATEYGKEATRQAVKELVPHDALIVSGLAYGIDITAHRAALENGLPTVAVTAGGHDKIYPAVHKKTASEILDAGGLMTEQSLGVKPETHFFPARNRIIAGMSDALIVVEAAKKGGALITANIAYSYDREVFAVPGDLDSKFSEGCNALIRSQRANIYTGVRDLEYLLDWKKGGDSKKNKSIDFNKFSDEERKLLKVLMEFKSGLQLDELSWKSQIAVNSTVSLLLNLEFAGVVKSLPGKKYQVVQ